jgi:6-methylsalicylate decarboxylase
MLHVVSCPRTHRADEIARSTMSKPTTIDVHAHFLPPVYQDALRDAGLKTLDGGIPTPTWSPERALAIMDEVGVTGAVLSVSSPHLNFVNQSRAIVLARSINDYAAEIKRCHPDRFGAYAILPLPDIAASLAELNHALDQLELDGVALPTHIEGRYLGDAHLAPLLAALDARQATVFVHPTSPPCFEAFGLELPAPMIEFPFDTTRTALSLLYSGALARHPGINFILPHGGGTLPFLAPRIAAVGSLTPVLGDRAIKPADAMQALARFYYDTALSVTPQQIAALRALASISRVLYGTDFPFANEDRLRGADAAFDALTLTAEEQTMVRHRNAIPLFEAFAARCCE